MKRDEDKEEFEEELMEMFNLSVIDFHADCYDYDEYDSFKYVSMKRWNEYVDKYIHSVDDYYDYILKTLIENNK